MSTKVCKNGHSFEKTSDCPVCPVCSKEEMDNAFGEEFPRIGAPAFRALHSAGINSLSDAADYSEKELLALHGFGPRALGMLRERLKEKGMSFARE